MKTRLLICMMLAMLLLCAGASADCETHGFVVMPCTCLYLPEMSGCAFLQLP